MDRRHAACSHSVWRYLRSSSSCARILTLYPNENQTGRVLYTGSVLRLMKYRSRSDIIESILRASNKGATMTRIRYGSCLSHSQLTKYLRFLQDRRLLQFDPTYKHYTLTERGLHALGAFGELNDAVARQVWGAKKSNPSSPDMNQAAFYSKLSGAFWIPLAHDFPLLLPFRPSCLLFPSVLPPPLRLL
jgi:predicted transcriptional regulator